MRDEGSYEAIPEPDREAIRALAVARCDLCDDDGYRAARVCDHRTHSSAEARERAKAVLAGALNRKADQ